MTLAVVIIAHERRRESTFPRVLDSVIREAPDEIVVTADFPVEAKGVRSLVVPSVTRTTCDALVKRDVGWIATQTDHICYLSDDHALATGFMDAFRAWSTVPDILVPHRFCWRPTETPPTKREAWGDTETRARQWLPVGQPEGYAAGHCAIFARWCGHALPWAASYYHPNWDVLHTMHLKKLGARISWGGPDLAVEDLEPEARPWEMTAEQQRATNAFHQSIRGTP